MAARIDCGRVARPHGDFSVLCGPLETALADVPDDTFDAAFGDPPYNVPKIGHHDKSGEWVEQVRWKPGTTDTQWTEIARTCKTGAPVLTYSFGGVKLFEQVVRMEAAGISFIGVLPWLFNTAFPKGLAIGMQLDKRQIAVATRFKCPNSGWRDMEATSRYKPVTPDGVRWEPYESTLRQMWNPVLVGVVGGTCSWFDLSHLHRNKAGTAERSDTDHPNVKPAIVNRDLAARILAHVTDDTTGPSKLLVPWSGVGSEIAGALAAGWDEVVGVEIDPEYAKCSQTRVPNLLERLR